MIQRCCSLNSISKRESVAFGLILLAGKKNQERENGWSRFYNKCNKFTVVFFHMLQLNILHTIAQN